MQINQKQDRMYRPTLVKGLTIMSTLKKLTSYIDELVIDHAKATRDGYQLKFVDLDMEEKSHLAYLMFEHNDRDTSDFLIANSNDPINDNISCALAKFLRTNGDEPKQEFADFVQSNIIKIYHAKIQTLIDERCTELEADIAATNGKYRYQDRVTGQFHWERI